MNLASDPLVGQLAIGLQKKKERGYTQEKRSGKDPTMGRPRKEELRELKEEEWKELKRVVKATSERLDVIKRAKGLLAVAAGATLTKAAQEAGLSREAVAQMVVRFNQRGLAVLEIAAGRGGKPMYTSEQRARVLREVQREPDREKDQTATWSLLLLRDALRKTDLPQIAAETIREVLHEAGYSYQRTRTWCRTGYALRVRKSGTVTVYDLETRGAKKID
jgi:transposase